MKKISKKLSRLIVAAVLTGGVVYCGSAWAESTVIQPGNTGNNIMVMVDGWSNNGIIGTGASPYGNVYAGYIVEGNSYDNMLTIDSGVFGAGVYGGSTENGNAMNNSVFFNGGTMNGYMYGAVATTGSVSENEINITGGSMNYVYGGSGASANVAKNTVTMNDGFVKAKIGGGSSNSGDVVENSLIVNGGTVQDSAIGAMTSSGNAIDNTVEICGGSIGFFVYGGYVLSGAGNAIGNIAEICGGSIGSQVYGGFVSSQSGNAIDNIVELCGGSIGQYVCGGYVVSGTGNAIGNTVSISGGTVTNSVCGGHVVSGTGNAEKNVVNISGGSIGTTVYGGEAGSGSAIGNVVNISAGIVNHDVSGGYVSSGSAKDNIVIVSGGTISGIRGAYSTNGIVTNNIVNISGGIASSVYGGMSNSGNVTKNIVVFSGGTASSVYGGYISVGNGNASKNYLNISEGNFGTLYGGYAGTSGCVTGNTVLISGGSFKNYIYGGQSGSGDATYNKVVVYGGTVTGDIYGGSSNSGTTSNNTVQISSNTALSSTNDVYGGKVESTGNVLVIDAAGININSAVNFDTYVFAIPIGVTTNDCLLSTTSALTVANKRIGIIPDYSAKVGDKIVLASNIDYTGVGVNRYYDLSDGNVMASPNPIINNTEEKAGKYILTYTVEEITKWTDVQPGSLTDNVVVVDSNTTVEVNGSVQTLKDISVTPKTNWQTVYGGYITALGAVVLNNAVTINNGLIKDVYGGYSQMGNVIGNTVTINGGTIQKCIFGGMTSAGGSSDYTVRENTVIINGGTFGDGFVCGGQSNSSSAIENSVIINGGEFGCDIYGGKTNNSDALNWGNSVIVRGGSVSGSVYGGHSNDRGYIKDSNVVVSGGTIDKIYGGYSYGSGVITDSVVIINGGLCNQVCGGYIYSGTTASQVTDNIIVISGGSITGAVYGGCINGSSGSAKDNSVQISNNTALTSANDVYGGYASDTAGNTLIIDEKDINTKSAQKFTNYVFAIPTGIAGTDVLLTTTTALVTDGKNVVISPDFSMAENTKVTLASNVATGTLGTVEYDLSSGNKMDNITPEVTIVSDTQNALVYTMGAITQLTDVQPSALSGNSVLIDGSVDNDDKPLATVNGLTYTFKAGTSGKDNWQDVYGGYSTVQGAAVMNNVVDIRDGVIEGNVYGGYSKYGTVTSNNIVKIYGGTFATTSALYGGNKMKDGNTLVVGMNDLSVASVNNFQNYIFDIPGDVASGEAVLKVTGKAFVIDNSDTIKVNIGALSVEPDILNPIVLIEDSNGFGSTDIDSVTNKKGYKEENEYTGNFVIEDNKLKFGVSGVSKYVSVISNVITNNVVVVNGGTTATIGGEPAPAFDNGGDETVTVWKNVYGGYNEAVNAEVKNNSVTITSGAQITGNIYGGYSVNGTAKDNDVAVKGGIIKGDVYGGYSKTGDACSNEVRWEDGTIEGKLIGGYSETEGRDISGNWLELVHNGATKSIKDIKNFNSYWFSINAAKNNDTVLKITNAEDKLNMPSGQYVVTIEDSKNDDLRYAGRVCLIESNKGINDVGVSSISTEISDGIVDTYGHYTVEDDKKLIYTKTSEVNKDGSKAPVEGVAAAASTINTSSDLVLGAGISNLIVSTAGEDNTTETFAASSYGKSKLNTGSHVDIRGYDVVVGVGRKVFSKNGNKTTGGLFFEYGNNNYDTFNNGYNGDGKSIRKGAGYLMRWDNKSGNYYEGMVHVGKVTNNWNNGAGYNYDMSPTYFGGAATYGHKFMLGDNKQLSVYGSYIYNRTGGGDAVIGNYNYNFEATKSHRTKVGVRYTISDLMDTKKFRPYVGLAWEHEFDGESNASISAIKGFFNGRPESPSMKGDTGILELGCKQEVGKWTLGIGAEVFTGKRKGWNGTLHAAYNF